MAGIRKSFTHADRLSKTDNNASFFFFFFSLLLHLFYSIKFPWLYIRQFVALGILAFLQPRKAELCTSGKTIVFEAQQACDFIIMSKDQATITFNPSCLG